MAVRLNGLEQQLLSKIKLYVEMQTAIVSDVAIMQAPHNNTKFGINTLGF